MVDVVVTRKFRLDNLNISDDLLIFQDLVNKQIMQGLQLPYDVFDNKSLISVKRFYKQVNNCSCVLRERVHRCGAQYSYFAVREYRRNQENLSTIIDILLINGFFRDNSEEILEKTDLSVFEIGNKIAFIRNLMLKEFDHIDLKKFYNDKSELVKYQQLVSKSLGNRKFLDKILRSFNHRTGRRLNARFKELHSANYQKTSNYDKTILQILRLNNITDVSRISKYEWDMGKKKYRIHLKNSLHGMSITNNNWGKLGNESQVIRRLIRGGEGRRWINGASLTDLLQFIQQELDELLMKQMIDYYKIHSLPEINKFLVKLQHDFSKQIPSYLKIPEFRKSSIALGIDDGQAYELEEQMDNGILRSVDIKISMRAGISHIIRIRNVDRYQSMIENGFSAHRGVLSFSRGKYYIFIPFKKKASEKRDSDLIASADLGLKTFATLSVFDKNKEIDRKFLDQKYLGGKKEDWFTSNNMLDLKSKLVEHRYVARRQQSVRMKSKKRSMKHWFARNLEKGKWRKIDNIHQELVNQIATRIIAYLNYHNVSTLVLENLKWSTHSSKSKVGYFLSIWQVHWFFSQVQEMLKNMALLHGIHVELVNPRNSSTSCWRCGEFGTRNGKRFICISNACIKYQLDSDLNAARNLVKRSKRYRRLISRPYSPMLYAEGEGFRQPIP